MFSSSFLLAKGSIDVRNGHVFNGIRLKFKAASTQKFS